MMMAMEWQSPIALLIVAVALGAFIYSLARPRRRSGCGKGCGCKVGKKDVVGK